ncbi:hypothetical protein SOCE26_088120 [Sorangium cellulosum]|uniref:ADYC domain-containing protein n=1 Tax=Sorangium cellulosum TaxID=56 RepID=A0A2L0F6S2_SORCE|nr:hypothetical protein SOCE26_088120 [Sorangium cellulosum]
MFGRGVLSGLVIALVSLSVGCVAELDGVEGVEREVEIGESLAALRGLNSINLNGTQLNGTQLNGIQLNGIRYNGIRYNGVALTATLLHGTRESDGRLVSGSDFIGVELDATLDDRSTVALRITNVVERSGITYYTVKYDRGGGLWANICGEGLDAIPVRGIWDPATGDYSDDGHSFTFGCQGAAIGKCAEWGYRDWQREEECKGSICQSRDLSYFHRACVRLVRADYCGDGVAHTRTGTAIDLWDALDIQRQTEGTGMSLEAEWTVDGAACVRHTRWRGLGISNPDYDYIMDHCPERWAGNDPRCGGSSSTFYTQNGFLTPLGERRILRNASYTTNFSP